MSEPVASMPELAAPRLALPVGSAGTRASGWWGVIALIVTEGALFGYLLFAYFYLAAQNSGPWPPDGLPDLRMPAIATVLLLGSSVLVWLGERSVRNNRPRAALAWLGSGLGSGALFVLIQFGEWHKKPFQVSSHVYGSLYFTITGFHLAHVAVGLGILAVLILWIGLGYVGARRHVALSIAALYWHFVDAVWLCVFSALYLTPYLFGGRA